MPDNNERNVTNGIESLEMSTEELSLEVNAVKSVLVALSSQLDDETKAVEEVKTVAKANQEYLRHIHGMVKKLTEKFEKVSTSLPRLSSTNRVDDTAIEVPSNRVTFRDQNISLIDQQTINESRLARLESNSLKKIHVNRKYLLEKDVSFAVWLEHLKSELNFYELIEYLEPNNLLGNTEEVTKNKNVIKDIIISRVDKKYHSKIIGMKEPAQILETLKDLRKIESNLNIHMIKRDIYNMKIKPKETISDFSRRFDELIALYESCDPKQPLTESDIASAFYIGTCERYPELRAAVNLSNVKLHEEMNIEEMKSILLQAEKDKAKPDQVPAQAARVVPARDHANHERCFRCDKAGHLHRDCPLRSQNLYFCFGCKKVVGHKTYDCPEVEKKRYVDKDSNGGGHGRGGGGGGKMRGRGGRGGRGRGERGKPYARGNEKQKKEQFKILKYNTCAMFLKGDKYNISSLLGVVILSNGTPE
ncbi:hypothetical protein TKK_0015487 [Trichogramma kaykai]